jgi:hypothetical protein
MDARPSVKVLLKGKEYAGEYDAIRPKTYPESSPRWLPLRLS